MNRVALIIAAFAFVGIAVPSNGQAQSSESWVSLIKENSVAKVASQLKESGQWPIIISSYRANRLPEKERAEMLQRIDAAKELLKKAGAEFGTKTPTNQGDLQKEIEVLSILAERAKAAGGYTNLLLADSFNRLIIYRLAEWVVAHPEYAAFCGKLLASAGAGMDQNYVDVLRMTADDDEAFIGKKLDFGEIDPKGSIFQSLNAIGITQNDVLASMRSSKTSALLEKPSAVALATRITETVAMKDVHLAGLITFFERGGTISELNPSDVTAFEKRMGNDLRDYKYPQAGIRRLSSDHLLVLIDLQRNQAAGTYFLSMAFQ